jgi:subtilisin family serine protease
MVVDGGSALALVNLQRLMARSSGNARVRVALLDGPVSASHPDLAGAELCALDRYSDAVCIQDRSGACMHGTFIVGILAANRHSRAPGICPDCPVLVRPIFRETGGNGRVPTATPDEVAGAIAECVAAGARVLNLSAATGEPSMRAERALQEALDYATRRGVVVVAAAGNQATLGSSVITRHPWVIPVVAYNRRGRPMTASNLGTSIGRRGLGAPGEGIESLRPGGGTGMGGGTSSAAAFVTGAIALLSSLYPEASATALKWAITNGGSRRAVTPPLLNADAALGAMDRAFGRRGVA